jgi:peptidoglycan/LPS O-acetylase OafA/YrhL
MADSAATTTPRAHLAYLANLRFFVVVLVVGMHSNVTYSGLGGWYYTEVDSDDLSLAETVPFALYGTFTQAWFMGCLFFIAGVLAAGSLARKGRRGFVLERLLRLGVPLMLYVLLITPFIGWVLIDSPEARPSTSLLSAYGDYLTSWDWVGGTGPMWFVEALLLMSVAYAFLREPLSRIACARRVTTPTMLWAMGITTCVAFALRLVWPIGSDVANLQFGFFASYIVLFAMGIWVGETSSLSELARSTGAPWFRRALVWGLAGWTAIIGAVLASGNVDAMNGGSTWQSLGYAAWESFVAIAMSIGIVSLFARRFNAENRATRFLAANAFGLYMLHAPVLIAISLAVQAWGAAPLIKHACVWPVAVAATIALTAALRVIRPVARILK